MKYAYLHLSVFMAILFFLCATLLFLRWYEGHNARRRIETLSASLNMEAAPLLPNLPLSPIFQIGGVDTPCIAMRTEKDILPPYQALYRQNPDIVGWIEIPGTLLSLPVMHTPEDPEYYLHRMFDGSESIYGTPFLDADCHLEPRSTNLILHGHHMRDGTMFSVLTAYTDKAFYQEHPLISFNTLYEENEYEILSAFLSVYDETDQSPDLYYNFIDTQDRREFDRFVAQAKDRSLYDTGVAANYSDELLTLITCSYHAENGRMTLICKKKTPAMGVS